MILSKILGSSGQGFTRITLEIKDIFLYLQTPELLQRRKQLAGSFCFWRSPLSTTDIVCVHPHTVRHEDCQTWVKPRTMQCSVESPGYRANYPEAWALWAARTVLLWISVDGKRCTWEFMANSCGRITKLVPRVLGQCHVFGNKELKWKWSRSVMSNSLWPHAL